MSDWMERFRNLGKRASQQSAAQQEEQSHIEENKERIKKERTRVVNGLRPQIQKVCKEFARSLKWKYCTVERHDMDLGFGVELDIRGKDGITRTYCGISGGTYPSFSWHQGKLINPHEPYFPIEGVVVRWDRYIAKPRWTAATVLNSKNGKMSRGYYWRHSETDGRDTAVGPLHYFMPLGEFTEERFAGILEELYTHCAPDIKLPR